MNISSKKIGYLILGIFIGLDIYLYNDLHAGSSVIHPHVNNGPLVQLSNMADDIKFNIAMKTIMRHEGGLSNNKNDPGEITKYGISLRFLRSENLDINNDGKINSTDIIYLNLDAADKIYYKKWYQEYGYGRIVNQRILTKIMDASVNMGASQAHKLVTRALNTLYEKQLYVDGILDNPTVMLINHTNPDDLYKALVKQEISFYRSIVKRNVMLKGFEKGWIARAND